MNKIIWIFILLGIFIVAAAVRSICALTEEKIILKSVILTTVVVMSLTLYTFWAARRGHDFSFLEPFTFEAMMILLVFLFVLLFIQMLFPLSRIPVRIYVCLASIIFCGSIIYDTDNLIKRYTYDEYIRAAITLYLDIINLFISLLLFRAAESRRHLPLLEKIDRLVFQISL